MSDKKRDIRDLAENGFSELYSVPINKSFIVKDSYGTGAETVMKNGLLTLKAYTNGNEVPENVKVGTIARSSESDTKLLIAQQIGDKIYWVNKTGGVSSVSTDGTTIEGDGTYGNAIRVTDAVELVSKKGQNGGYVGIDSDGKVGIGNVSPSEKLDVTGNIKVSGQLISSVASGTSPLSITSPTLVTNLNADTLDGVHASGFVSVNQSISSATKTKITYDTKGLVTSGTDATTADIADSTDKRYCTDAQKMVIGNISGTNTGDETGARIAGLINASSEVNSPDDADKLALSGEGFSVLKKITWDRIKASLKTYFDTLYANSSINIDGGVANSVYTSTQNINGGNA